MLYTLFILFGGIYLGQEYDIIPSVKILLANMFLYLRSLKDPTNNLVVDENAPTYFERFKNYFFL